MKRPIITVVFILLFAIISAGDGNTSKTITVTDSTGRSIPIRLPVKRVVVLNSDALEVIRALKAEDLVVGVTNSIVNEPLFWPKLKDRPAVGSWREANCELIAELNPDIVICYGRWPGPYLEKKLEPFGIKIVRLDFWKIHSLEKEIEILGRILKREERARQLIDWYEEKLKLIKERLKNLGILPDVYLESYSEYSCVGPGPGAHVMCILAGGHNIAADSSIPYPKVTPEWVLAKNPDIIIKVASFSTYTLTDPEPLKNIRKTIMARPAWNNIKAVEDGKVYVLSPDIWAGPRSIIGISYMAKWFHPDIFKDIDPRKLHREYLEKFQGIKYQGLYVYPPE